MAGVWARLGSEGVSLVIVELSVVEQRYQAVLEVVQDGATVTDVARRHGVARHVRGHVKVLAGGQQMSSRVVGR